MRYTTSSGKLHTLKYDTVIQTSHEHEFSMLWFNKMRQFALAFGQPFVIPLAGDGAALRALNACPHAATVNKVFRARVGCIKCLVLKLGVMGDKAPFHGREDKIRLGGVATAQDWHLGVRRNVVTWNKSVSALPISDGRVMAVELFDFG